MKDIFTRSILAGICIGIGSAIFLKLSGICGAVMFSFGLLCVIHFKLPLYTGTAGFINIKIRSEWTKTIVILLGNIFGCFLLSCCFGLSGIQENAMSIVNSRIDAGYLNCLLRSCGCGLIMTLIVKGGRDKNLILILFGIPIFILLGFYHSIADAAYLFICKNVDILMSYLPYYMMIVIGNFIGCNIPRILKYDNKY